MVDGEKPTIIDFEEACDYPFVFDLGMAIVGTCTDEGSVNLGKASALLQGYQQARVLSPQEKSVLQLFAEYGAIATSFWRYRQFNIRNPTPEKKDAHREMTDIADSIAAIEADAFRKVITP